VIFDMYSHLVVWQACVTLRLRDWLLARGGLRG